MQIQKIIWETMKTGEELTIDRLIELMPEAEKAQSECESERKMRYFFIVLMIVSALGVLALIIISTQ